MDEKPKPRARKRMGSDVTDIGMQPVRNVSVNIVGNDDGGREIHMKGGRKISVVD